jgi:hypothetical protein
MNITTALPARDNKTLNFIVFILFFSQACPP